MCTVTFIPTDKGYHLSSNRDESPSRAHNPLVQERIGHHDVVFPRDPKGGSWLFTSNKKEVVCVLNGAHIKHKHRPPYRTSRGIIARSYFNYEGPKDFMRTIDLKGIEPFTMILTGPNWLYVFRWNEKEKHVDILDPKQSYIWSSSTLYDPEMVEKRKQWFEQYEQNHPDLTLADIRYIHRNGSVGDPEQDYIMNRRNIVCTVSISHITVDDEIIIFEFENIIDGESHYREIPLSIAPSC